MYKWSFVFAYLFSAMPAMAYMDGGLSVCTNNSPDTSDRTMTLYIDDWLRVPFKDVTDEYIQAYAAAQLVNTVAEQPLNDAWIAHWHRALKSASGLKNLNSNPALQRSKAIYARKEGPDFMIITTITDKSGRGIGRECTMVLGKNSPLLPELLAKFAKPIKMPVTEIYKDDSGGSGLIFTRQAFGYDQKKISKALGQDFPFVLSYFVTILPTQN